MVKKIKKHVERHYDDLGDDLSGLGKLEIDNLFVDRSNDGGRHDVGQREQR